MTQISYCPKLSNPKNISNIQLEKALEDIKNIDTPLLQKVRNGDIEAKKSLPCIIFSGTFSQRNKNSMIEASGYMILDFDKLEYPALFRDTIFNENSFVKASFLSPSGTGVKVVVRIPKIKTELEFVEIFNNLQLLFPKLDKSGKDLARVCFVSYDPDIKIRDNETVFIKIENAVIRTQDITENQIIDKLLIWFNKKYSLAEGNRNNSLYALSCALFRYGVEDHIQILKNLNSGLPDSEITAVYNSADRSTTHNSVEFEPPKTKPPIIKSVEDEVSLCSFDYEIDYEIDYTILDHLDITHIITDVLKYTIRTNEVTKRLEINNEPMTDAKENILYAELDSHIRKSGYSKKSPNKQIFTGALAKLSETTYNPIKEKLESIKWDGISRLVKLCICLKDKNNVGSTYLYHFILGAIERLYYGYQNPILVLDGQQKIGKSSLVNFLGSSFKKYYVADGSLDPESKDDKLALCENFIYNWEEGASFSKRQMEAVKSLVFSDNQRIRRPYAKYDEDYKVNASIIMPKNQGEFLTDVTGNRRYNIVQLDTIDYSYSGFNPDQIWAEAYSLWLNDTQKLWQKFDTEKRDRINESMMITPAIYDILDEVIKKSDSETDFVSNTDLYTELQRRDSKFDRNKMTKVISNYARTNNITQEKRRGVRGFVGINIDVKPYNY